MFVLQGFPGTPQTQQATAANAACTATLPVPGAGFRQYLAGFIITADKSAAGGSCNVNFTGLDAGAGSAPNFIAVAPANTGLMLALMFPRPWPASAEATSIACQLAAGLGATQSVTLYGYNVPE